MPLSALPEDTRAEWEKANSFVLISPLNEGGQTGRTKMAIPTEQVIENR